MSMSPANQDKSSLPNNEGDGGAFSTRKEIGDAVKALSKNKKVAEDVAFRRHQLSSLLRMLHENRGAFEGAIERDFKSCFEARAEVSMLIGEAVHALDNMDSWIQDASPSVSLAFKLDACRIRPRPLGLALVIGTWNYPLLLALQPLVGAIAAGNCVLVKPSEIALATATTLARLFPRYVDQRTVRLILAAPDDAAWTVEQAGWDAVFFTGSKRVARLVSTAVIAQNPTCKLTLELGGKCPAIVCPDASMSSVVPRLVWGKLVNAGQTCIAPDYVLLVAGDANAFAEQLLQCIRRMYGEDPSASPDYSRIVSEEHKERLEGLLRDTVHLSVGSSPGRHLAPSVVLDPPRSHPIMQEEIFGPLLPVVSVETLDEAVAFIESGDRPLAVYVFAGPENARKLGERRFHAGAVVINDVLMHAFGTHARRILVPELPFGGVGASGIGCYHGRHTFSAFSHLQSAMHRTEAGEWINEHTRYPPMTDGKMAWMERLLWAMPSKRHLSH